MKRFVAAMLLFAAVPSLALAEDDGQDFLSLMRKPKARALAQRHIDNAADKWDG
ncbi:MAG: hypothetical protein JNL33_02985, partial [Betaproteobacteria bacterium]|nr:hypothetical protein [Betaproteobacteria bacterium]